MVGTAAAAAAAAGLQSVAAAAVENGDAQLYVLMTTHPGRMLLIDRLVLEELFELTMFGTPYIFLIALHSGCIHMCGHRARLLDILIQCQTAQSRSCNGKKKETPFRQRNLQCANV